MTLNLTTFYILFPIGLGALFGIVRYTRMAQANTPNAVNLAAFDALKRIVGAGAIIFAYKSFGIL